MAATTATLTNVTMDTSLPSYTKYGSGILVRNVVNLEAKIKRMKEDGASKLQVILDFDQTITRAKLSNGKEVGNTHDLVARSGVLSTEAVTEIDRQIRQYVPYYIDETLALDKKCMIMEEWWRLTHEVFIDSKINKSQIPDMVTTVPTPLRPGYLDYFKYLYTKNVPVLIFSAGLEDPMIEILSQEGIPKYGNMQTLGNKMMFDDQGTLIGFKEPIIHSFNKKDMTVVDADRPNIIIMGDSLGDLQMAGKNDHDRVLSIGFYNDDNYDRLDLYLQAYDMIVLHDGPMDGVNLLMQDLLD